MEQEQLVDLQDRVQQAHSNLFKAMLSVNELPEALLVRYFAIKKSLDRVDGLLTPYALLRIAMDVGFNPETGKFEKDDYSKYDSGILPEGGTVEIPADKVEVQATNGEGEDITIKQQERKTLLEVAAALEEIEIPEGEDSAAEVAKALDEGVVVKPKNKAPLGLATYQAKKRAAKRAREEAAKVSAEKATEELEGKSLAVGTEVEGFDENAKLIKGKVTGCIQGGSGIEYSVEDEDGVIHNYISEDNIEVI